ncbi:MAG: SH3 domain-containing protein, partial [Phycisphaeraceae bacterium]
MFRYRHTFVASMVVSVASIAFAATSGAANPPFTGVINNNDVYVRSGASKNYYDVAKLQSGTVVQVRELLYGWYAIDPPPGSFSYVSQAYVQLAADGKTGTVTGDNVRVRAPAAGGPSRS